MHKNIGKKIKAKREEQINKGFFVQIILSIILVIVVILCKNSNNYIGNRIIAEFDNRLDEKIDFIEIISIGKKFIENKTNEFISAIILDEDYIAPVSGEIVRKYGISQDYENEFYHGMDIKTSLDHVKAIANGTVKKVGYNDTVYNYVVIEVGKKEILYTRLDSVNVVVGDMVQIGEILGSINSNDNLLHIEVWENGVSINPSSLFKLY